MAKGADYEREICKLLSEWWEPGRDDIFWRSSNSGGRATIRKRKGKRTSGHCGDIAFTDSIGKPLIEALTIEIKRGYSESSFADALDRAPKSKQKMWESFVSQARIAAKSSGSVSWLLIHRRDRKIPMVYFPGTLWGLLKVKKTPKLWVTFRYGFRMRSGKIKRALFCATSLKHFLRVVKRSDIERIARAKKD